MFLLRQRLVGQFRPQPGDDVVDHFRLVQDHGPRNRHRQPLLFAFDDDVEFFPQFADHVIVVVGQQVYHGIADFRIGVVDEMVHADSFAALS